MIAERPPLQTFLPTPVWELVKKVISAASELDYPLYLVGGLVRDWLLNRPSTDLDFVMVGDAIALGKRLHTKRGGKLLIHGRFGTANWRPENFPNGIDLITARSESYAQPAALPDVTFGTIEDDLARRDFTINAFAIRLDEPHFGTLLDQHGGVADLEAGIVRVIHDQSFVDDPTRTWRAMRYIARLGFKLEENTAAYLKNSLPMLRHLAGERVQNELMRLLQEPEPEQAFALLASMGVLAETHPHWRWDDEIAAAFQRLRQLNNLKIWQIDPAPSLTLWMAYLPTWESILNTLRVWREQMDDVLNLVQMLALLEKLNWSGGTRPSEVEKALRWYANKPGVLLAAVAFLGSESTSGRLLTRYQTEWRHVKTNTTGHTLKALGLKPGPHFQTILDELLAARLDGLVNSDAEEGALLMRLCRDF